MANSYDVIVIGAGHNGLVAAAYLARAGRRVLVLERRPVVGGGAVTEEVFPGFKVDVADHFAFLHPDVVRDLSLARHGLQMLESEAALYAPALDGQGLLLSSDVEQSAAAIARFSRTDADRWPGFLARLGKAAHFLGEIHKNQMPSPLTSKPGELMTLGRLGLALRGLGGKDMMETIRLLPISVAELLNDWFEADLLKGMIGALGVHGLQHGVRASGTTYNLLHQLALRNGTFFANGRVRGGIGAATQALAAAAKERGAEIRTGSDVKQIVVKDGRATGVVLASGEEIQARIIISNADPRRTFLGLLDAGEFDPEFLWEVGNIRMRGAVAKVNLAVSELPRFKGAPEGDSHLRGTIMIAPGLDYLERASDAVKYGAFSERPWLEVVIPTLADSGLAPAGKHLLSIHAQYAPYRLAAGWNERRRKEVGDRIIATLAEYAPNVPKSILHRQVLTPVDLQETFGVTEGNIHHGEHLLDQIFFMRPVGGWSQYRTPIEQLYLCGAGVHPGGGVSGLPGKLAAQAVLKG